MNKQDKKNRIETHWSMLCKTVSVDQQSNQVSIFNVIEELQVSNIALLEIAKAKDGRISLPMEFSLITQNEKINPDKGSKFTPELRLQVLDPMAKELLKTEIPLAFKITEKRMRNIFSFSHMLLTGPGEYQFVLSIRLNKEEDFEQTSVVKLEVIFK